jgi:microcystin-dependent protein
MDDWYIGEIRLFAGNYAPHDWALCDGSVLKIVDNTALFSLLSNRYGGDGTTTFALPDLRGRAPLHQIAGEYPLGAGGGLEQVTLQLTQVPAHTHTLAGTTTAAQTADPENNLPAEPSLSRYAPSNVEYPDYLAARSVGQTGGQGHDNMPPFLVLNYIIALNGVFPPHWPPAADSGAAAV